MNKDQTLGLVREFSTAAGVALVTFGLATSGTVELVSGVLLAVVSLYFAIKANEGSDVVLSFFRKILSGIAGYLVTVGYLDPAKAEALSGVVLVLASSVWTIGSKSNGPPTGGNSPLWVFALLAICLLPSCTGIMAGVTGQPIAVEPVQTKEGKTFNVASADLLRAQSSPPETAWGLYNAGLVAQRAREVIDSGK